MKNAIVLGLLLALGLALVSSVEAQPPDTLWTRTFGGGNNDYSYSVQQTSDGGYVIAGWTHSSGAGGADVYLVKTDISGNSVWTHTFGGSSNDYGYSVQQTSDGGYIIAGETWSYGSGGGDVYLIKTNTMGNLIWSQSFGGTNNDYGYSVRQTLDGGYIIVGYTYSFGLGGSDVLLIKTDATGNPVWTQTFGGSNDDQGFCVQQITGGGYIIAGDTRSTGAGSYDAYLIKTDANGNSIWQHTFGGSQDDYGWSVQQTGDGGYAIGGTTFSYGAGGSDVYLIKTDAAGNQLWQHTFGYSDVEEGFSVRQTLDGGYVIAGYTSYFPTNSVDVYLVKTDTGGNLIWQCTFGGSEGEVGRSVQQTSDGGYVVAGYTESYGAGSYDVYLIKTDAGGAPLNVTLTPINPPITIPANGGSFNFNATLINNTTGTQTFDVWIMVQLPSTAWYGPVLGPLSLTLPGSGSLTRLRTQNIPGSAPAGNYWYEARVGDYPNTLIDTSGFSFTKLGSGDWGLGVSDWTNTGEGFVGGTRFVASHQGDMMKHVPPRISPNPFNPSTVLSFELRVPSHVSLRVYDTAGRLVATLVDGWREAGVHQVTFDGSNLPSGVYVYRLQAGENVASGKMVLLK